VNSESAREQAAEHAAAAAGGVHCSLPVFVLLPLGMLAAQTVLGPDGFTLEAWRALFSDAHVTDQVLATLAARHLRDRDLAALGGGHAWLTVRPRPAGWLAGSARSAWRRW
jgi:hypothetical protein